MAGPLKLEVVMSMVDKALAPMRGIDRQAKATARGLKETRDSLKALERAQDDVGEFRKMSAGLRTGGVELDAARSKVRALAQQLKAAEAPTRAMQREFSKAKSEAAALGAQQEKMGAQAQVMRDRLSAAGISTRNLVEHERQLRGRIDSTTQSLTRQTAALQAQGERQRKLAQIKDAHGKAMGGTAVMAGAGVAGVMTGRAVAAPIRTSLGAYGEQENASTQLRVSMMQADGSVPQDFQKISDLATRLGDRLPGTTAEFQEMMTMLRRQGLSAQTILGGTGEAAALLGVQLRIPVTEAAEFAAKMQDATRTTEGDMLGLMDTIQRTFYLGVDSGNMLQGFTKLSPVMGIIKKEGLEASKMLAPLLVMMDQTGMAGESAGNAIRKVFQGGFDEKKLGKANALLKGAGAGFKLDFSDGKGEFGGLDKLFAQLEQLKKLDTTKRTSVIKQLFGDDSETLQVIDTFMSKGIAGYNEVANKMAAQADLRKRVDVQLGTLSNVVEAAQGTWTNVLASIGETVAPDAKSLVGWLGDAASAVGAWAKANPTLVAWLVRAAAVVAVLYAAIGGLMIGLAGVLAPMLMVRFALASLGVQGGLMSVVLRGLGAAARFLGTAVMGVVRLLMANPIIAIVAGIATAAYLIYRHWGAIVGFFSGLWASVKVAAASAWQQLGGSFQAVLATLAAAIVNWSPVGLFYRAFAGVLSYFGIELPARFTEFGANIMQGLVNGITNGLGFVRNAVGAAADTALGWFKDKLGIRSPSRLFMAAGVNVGEGAALGIESTTGLLQRSALGMAAAASVALPAMAGMPALAMPQASAPMEQAAPIMASAGPRTAQPAPAPAGDRIEIHIHAAPGMDMRALADAVRAEMERLDAAKRARAAGSFYDLNN